MGELKTKGREGVRKTRTSIRKFKKVPSSHLKKEIEISKSFIL
ncbi:MAG: hypothetical protein ACLTGQ_12575 [Mediterraneibacter gnavus]